MERSPRRARAVFWRPFAIMSLIVLSTGFLTGGECTFEFFTEGGEFFGSVDDDDFIDVDDDEFTINFRTAPEEAP